MKWAVRVIAICAVIVVAIIIAIIAAIGEEAKPPAFELKDWEIVTNASVSIGFTYSADKDVSAVLLDPKGEEVGYAFPSAVATYDKIDMAGFGKTPLAGTYNLVVKHLGKPIFERSFTFSGAEVGIGEVSLDWSYDETFGWYTLETVTVELVNDGDLPAYYLAINGEIDGKDMMGEFVMGWVKPGKRIVNWEEPLTYVETAGTYTLEIVAGGDYEWLLAERTMTIQVP